MGSVGVRNLYEVVASGIFGFFALLMYLLENYLPKLYQYVSQGVTLYLLKKVPGSGTTADIEPGGILEKDIFSEYIRGLHVSLRAEYHAESTAGVRLRWLYSQDGVNFDTIEDAETNMQYFEPTFEPGKTRQGTVLVPFDALAIKLQVVNLDKNNPVRVTLWETYLIK